MSFRITALPVEPFAAFFDLSNDALAKHNVVRHTADRTPGFPCRVSLRDAEPGETLLLLNFEHLPVESPYRSRHAIYVIEHARQAHLEINEVPDVLRKRLLSLRGFDTAGMMQEADVVEGKALDSAIETLFRNPQVQYLHIHNAKPGCYAARVLRA